MVRRGRPLVSEREGIAPLMVCTSIILNLALIAMFFPRFTSKGFPGSYRSGAYVAIAFSEDPKRN